MILGNPASTDTTTQLLRLWLREHRRGLGKIVKDRIPERQHKQVQNNSNINGQVNMEGENFIKAHQ